jgi:hypothetical protein
MPSRSHNRVSGPIGLQGMACPLLKIVCLLMTTSLPSPCGAQNHYDPTLGCGPKSQYQAGSTYSLGTPPCTNLGRTPDMYNCTKVR